MNDEIDGAQVGAAGSQAPGEGAEPVEQQLARYAFIREERDREVRLMFRDAPAADLARAFRASGAALISMSGERAAAPGDVVQPVEEVTPETNPNPRHRRRPKPAAPKMPEGEVTIHYFFASSEIVYTVSLTSSSGLVESIAQVYPIASLTERELRDRLEVVFARPGS